MLLTRFNFFQFNGNKFFTTAKTENNTKTLCSALLEGRQNEAHIFWMCGVQEQNFFLPGHVCEFDKRKID